MLSRLQVYVIAGCFLHLYIFITLLEGDRSPSVVHFIFWSLALVGELLILISSAIRVHAPHTVLRNVLLSQYTESDKPDKWDYTELGIGLIRLSLVAFLVVLFLVLTLRKNIKLREKLEEEGRMAEADETTPLLNGNQVAGYNARDAPGRNGRHNLNQPPMGGANGAADHSYQGRDEEAAFYRPEKLPHKTWWEYIRGYSLFFPYLWPGD